MDIDILGSYNITTLCLPHLVDSAKKHNSTSTLPNSNTSGPGGRIIYVSATIHYTGLPMQTHVSVAKAGVDALSANVAIEYGPLGLTSNIIAPGPIAGTEGMDRLSKNHRKGEAAGSRRIPVGRWGLTKEINDATVFLFSDAANYVTGDKLVVDGGAWHVGHGPGGDFEYPDFILSGAEVTGVGGSRKRGSKL
jgi:2,4-dienoyl-CoA reductase [(3E)-enoyl-CoA-producing], peroxisomal